MKRRILALGKYPRRGGTTRLRMIQFFPALEESGLEIQFEPLFNERYLLDLYATGTRRWGNVASLLMKRVLVLFGMGRFDLLWIESEMLPYVPPWLERVATGLRIPYVVDYDDAIFHRYDTHSSTTVRSFLGGKIDSIMKNAAVVVAGNNYIADHARQAGARRVEIIPTVIDVGRYGRDRGAGRSRDRVRIGWIGNPTTRRYLEPIFPVLRRLQSVRDIQLVCIGSGPFQCEGLEIDFRDWSEESEAGEVADLDIGIMPLPDTPFERGKCGSKLLQYMASFLPAVASPVGVNSRIIEHGQTGFLASGEDQWFRYLEVLVSDPELRRRFGESGRKKVEAEYSLHRYSPRLKDILVHAA